MAERRPELRRGRIVWAAVRDRNGIEKQRPVIVVTATGEIREDELFEAMAITTTFPDPPPQDHIELPWDSRGRTLTKLRRRSAAVLSWIVEIQASDAIEYHSDVPMRLMTRILEALESSS